MPLSTFYLRQLPVCMHRTDVPAAPGYFVEQAQPVGAIAQCSNLNRLRN